MTGPAAYKGLHAQWGPVHGERSGEGFSSETTMEAQRWASALVLPMLTDVLGCLSDSAPRQMRALYLPARGNAVLLRGGPAPADRVGRQRFNWDILEIHQVLTPDLLVELAGADGASLTENLPFPFRPWELPDPPAFICTLHDDHAMLVPFVLGALEALDGRPALIFLQWFSAGLPLVPGHLPTPILVAALAGPGGLRDARMWLPYAPVAAPRHQGEPRVWLSPPPMWAGGRSGGAIAVIDDVDLEDSGRVTPSPRGESGWIRVWRQYVMDPLDELICGVRERWAGISRSRGGAKWCTMRVLRVVEHWARSPNLLWRRATAQKSDRGAVRTSTCVGRAEVSPAPTTTRVESDWSRAWQLYVMDPIDAVTRWGLQVRARWVRRFVSRGQVSGRLDVGTRRTDRTSTATGLLLKGRMTPKPPWWRAARQRRTMGSIEVAIRRDLQVLVGALRAGTPPLRVGAVVLCALIGFAAGCMVTLLVDQALSDTPSVSSDGCGRSEPVR